MNDISDVNIACAAGFFDGEGSICITNKSLSINVGNTVKEPLEFLKKTFGGTIYEYQPKGNTKNLYRWYIYREERMRFLKCILPYLRVKTEQVLLGTEFVITSHKDKDKRDTITKEMRELNKRGVSRDVAELNRKRLGSRISYDNLCRMMEENPR